VKNRYYTHRAFSKCDPNGACLRAISHSQEFHNSDVTSDLDPQLERADACQGGSGRWKNRNMDPKLFEIKILTSNP